MKAVVTAGNGGYEKLEYRDVPIPILSAGEMLIQVLAAGINNTEINTRIGWYAETAIGDVPGAGDALGAGDAPGAGWNGATPFPLIQGTDCCGRVAAVASGGDQDLVGARVLVRPCMRAAGFESLETVWMGSDFDGAFAQFVKAPAADVFAVECRWKDAELGSIPCAYGTAENMLHRARVSAGEHVLITGASGGVGSAAVQLAKRRGARVTAIAGKAKLERVREIGADRALDRDGDLMRGLGDDPVDVAIDIVAGTGFGGLLKALRRGGRYVTSGAIGGPEVTLDMRTLYLKDLTLIGSTAWEEPVFSNLIGYIERGEIRPLLAKTFPLAEIAAAQREFLEKKHVGKIVLIPPATEG